MIFTAKGFTLQNEKQNKSRLGILSAQAAGF
jgi:hypothetical protein